GLRLEVRGPGNQDRWLAGPPPSQRPRMPRTYRPGRGKGAIRPKPGQPRTSSPVLRPFVIPRSNSAVRIYRVDTATPIGTRRLGTLMRHVLELLDGGVSRVYSDLGVPDYRPRYSPVVRALVECGPLSIRDLASTV